MDSYLDIAIKVLRAVKRPMTAKSILDTAIKAAIVPTHLHGKTQHKTLQARLSEDILYNRTSSMFYRTDPGYFFLTEFLSDPSISQKFKEPFPARRRIRDLHSQPQLVIDENYLLEFDDLNTREWTSFIEEAFEQKAARFVDSKEKDVSSTAVWTFSLVRRCSFVLSYRLGRYRDGRDAFVNKKTIGFPGAVGVHDQTLFSEDDLGASENALNVILTDLDLSTQAFADQRPSIPEILCLSHVTGDDNTSALLLVMEWECPYWFEPTQRKLSINNPMWADVGVPQNDLHDFEPWSASTLEAIAGVGSWHDQKVN